MERLRHHFTRPLTLLASRLSQLAYPPRCAGCNGLLPEQTPWCPQCWSELALTTAKPCCPTCAAPLGPYQTLNSLHQCNQCKKHSPKIKSICRLGTYNGVLSQIVRSLKYNKNTYSGNLLADWLADKVADQPWLDEIDGFCPIPMHWTRRWLRRIDHTKIIADRLSNHTHLPVIQALRRPKPTPQQVGLSHTARMKNIKNAFKINPRWPIEGATLCLVDDVMTTGATLFEAARTLKTAGAAKIYAAILAKADNWDVYT
ncbi:MAG: ComF family protein [Phycisphaerae bacterium]|nr:ComF family protein [Phycisphaerae bacterium]